jgi:hypothetical protein
MRLILFFVVAWVSLLAMIVVLLWPKKPRERENANESWEETMCRLEHEAMPKHCNATVCDCGHIEQWPNSETIAGCVFYVGACDICRPRCSWRDELYG